MAATDMVAMAAMDTTEESAMLRLMPMPIMDMVMVAMDMEAIAMAAMDMEAMVAMDTTEESVMLKLMPTMVMDMVAVAMVVTDTAVAMEVTAMDMAVRTPHQLS